MPDYFGYIHEASYDDIDDVDVVYNEMDSSLAEFDSYVQEGVGLNVIIGIGVVAALAGVIALIVKYFSNKNSSSATNAAKSAKNAATVAKKAGVTDVKVEGGQAALNASEKRNEEVVKIVEAYDELVEKYFNRVMGELERLDTKYGDKSDPDAAMAELKTTMSKIFNDVINDFPILKKLTNSRTSSGVKKKLKAIGGDNEKAAEKALIDVAQGTLKTAQSVGIDNALNYVEAAFGVCRKLLFSGKRLNDNGKRLQAMLNKMGGNKKDMKLSAAEFDTITANISAMITKANADISKDMNKMNDYVKDALAFLKDKKKGLGMAEA